VTEVVVADRSRRRRGWTGIALGTVFGAIGTVSLAGLAAFAIGDPTPWFLVAAVIPLLFALGGAAGVVFGIRNLWLSHVLGVPTLVLPSGTSLCLGETVTARFHRSGGTRQARQAPQLTADLVCEERVTYRQGTDDHTVTREIERRELAVRTDQAPDTVSGQVTVPVPVDVPPSMTLPHNGIAWSVEVRVEVPGVPVDTGTFTVVVLPMVARVSR
jgi:hypothetical protein